MKFLIPYLLTASITFLVATLLFWTPYRNQVAKNHRLTDSVAVLNAEKTQTQQELFTLRTQSARQQGIYQRNKAVFYRQQDSLRGVVARLSLRQQVRTVVKTIQQPLYRPDTIRGLPQDEIFRPDPLGNVGFSLKPDSVCYDSLTHTRITERLLQADNALQLLDTCQQANAGLLIDHRTEREVMTRIALYPFWRSKKKAILNYQLLHPLP